jgi:hypothetical protein
MRSFVKSFTRFSWGLVVFGVSQTAYVLRGLPTREPTLKAKLAFKNTTDAMNEQFDVIDKRVFEIGDTVQGALIDLTFNFLRPATFNPRTVLDTSQNLARWGLGIAAQLIPGGRFGSGGPPQGWGPVNVDDAELFWVRGGINTEGRGNEQTPATDPVGKRPDA